MFEPRSYLQKLADVWVYPRIIAQAADAVDPVQRMKFAITWCVLLVLRGRFSLATLQAVIIICPKHSSFSPSGFATEHDRSIVLLDLSARTGLVSLLQRHVAVPIGLWLDCNMCISHGASRSIPSWERPGKHNCLIAQSYLWSK